MVERQELRILQYNVQKSRDVVMASLFQDRWITEYSHRRKSKKSREFSECGGNVHARMRFGVKCTVEHSRRHTVFV